ncbi:MAG: hypothetical protein GWP70_10190 [Proteobacteria bacterium]|nr:hypothetical protein [Pseudomonadota bacterium]
MIQEAQSHTQVITALHLLAAKEIDPLAQIYERFFRLCPEARGLMGHSDEPMRGRMLEQTFEILMDADLHGAESYFRWEITNHVTAYGVAPNMYDAYFEAIGQVLAEILGEAWSASLNDAWRMQVANLLADVAQV